MEVRDVHGEIRSVLFYPESGGLDFSQLRAGHTLFIRYAQRIHFADLSTEAIKVLVQQYCTVLFTLRTVLYCDKYGFGIVIICVWLHCHP